MLPSRRFPTPSAPADPSSHIARRVLTYGLPAVAAMAAGANMYRRLQRALPELDGTQSCPVNAPVKVLRDHWAIPHIYGASDHDLYVALGYVHAQDRLWQMDFQRRVGTGRLSEIFGPLTLANDILLRRFGIHHAALAEIDSLPEEAGQSLAAYAQGVNAFIELALRQRRLPIEFSLLRYEPEPWQPADSLIWARVLSWGLGGNWESELVRARLVLHLGPERAAALEPIYPTGRPLAAEPGSDYSGLDNLFAGMLDEYEHLVSMMGLGELIGGGLQASNNWAVAGWRSASGQALLANDPHLPLGMPSIWHLVHMQGGSYDVAGVTVPGVPGIMCGHNEHLAWGVTNAMIDVQDLYMEKLHPDDPTQVLYEGQWEKATVRSESIKVRGRPRPVVDDVLVTRHGPVISGEWLPSGSKWLHAGESFLNLPRRAPRESNGSERQVVALRWTAHAPGLTMQAVLDMNRAHDWQTFRTALRDWHEPGLNFVYADDQGNIGYQLACRVPIRKRGFGLVPSPGWTGEYEWQGMIPFEELPSSYNPPTGFVATANNRIAGRGYPYHLSFEWATGVRAQRITELLQARDKHTLHDFAAMQSDVKTLTGVECVRLVLATLDGDAEVKQALSPAAQAALGYLAAWDGQMTLDTVAGSIYSVFLGALTRRVFGLAFADADMLKYYLGASTQPVTASTSYVARSVPLLLEALRDNDLDWLRRIAHDPALVDGMTWSRIVAEALEQSVRWLRRKLGRDMARWRWRRLHKLNIAHPLGRVRPLAPIFNSGPVPTPGDRDSIWMSGSRPAEPFATSGSSVSYRQIFEAGAWDHGRIVMPGGQSGHPASTHYSDMLPLWRAGRYVPLAYSREAVASVTADELDLLPPAE